jgi:hypothetical protein
VNIGRMTIHDIGNPGLKIISEKDLPGIIAELIADRNPDKDRIMNSRVN